MCGKASTISNVADRSLICNSDLVETLDSPTTSSFRAVVTMDSARSNRTESRGAHCGEDFPRSRRQAMDEKHTLSWIDPEKREGERSDIASAWRYALERHRLYRAEGQGVLMKRLIARRWDFSATRTLKRALAILVMLARPFPLTRQRASRK